MTATSNKKTLLMLFGGESAEHEVSLISAQNIYAALDLQKIEPVLCYIDTQGIWWHVTSVARADNQSLPLIPLPGSSAVKIGDKTIAIDVIFPVLHGTNGEDGTVQGLAKLLHTPIVGCGIEGSAICIDKILTKQLLEKCGIPVVPSMAHHAGEVLPDYEKVSSQLGTTVFVKPARQGSSVGVSKASSAAELTQAIDLALRFDTDVLIESAVPDARELEVAMLDETQSAKASVVGEVIPDRDFYTYDSKYDSSSTTQTAIPANLAPETTAKVQDYARKAFSALHCQGLARVDFLLSSDGTLYLNEVNTMPGFTNISMYPKLWEASGRSYRDLVSALIDAAQ